MPIQTWGSCQSTNRPVSSGARGYVLGLGATGRSAASEREHGPQVVHMLIDLEDRLDRVRIGLDGSDPLVDRVEPLQYLFLELGVVHTAS